MKRHRLLLPTMLYNGHQLSAMRRGIANCGTPSSYQAVISTRTTTCGRRARSQRIGAEVGPRIGPLQRSSSSLRSLPSVLFLCQPSVALGFAASSPKTRRILIYVRLLHSYPCERLYNPSASAEIAWQALKIPKDNNNEHCTRFPDFSRAADIGIRTVMRHLQSLSIQSSTRILRLWSLLCRHR